MFATILHNKLDNVCFFFRHYYCNSKCINVTVTVKYSFLFFLVGGNIVKMRYF